MVSRALSVTCRVTRFPTPPSLWRVLTMTSPQVSEIRKKKVHTNPKCTALNCTWKKFVLRKYKTCTTIPPSCGHSEYYMNCVLAPALHTTVLCQQLRTVTIYIAEHQLAAFIDACVHLLKTRSVFCSQRWRLLAPSCSRKLQSGSLSPGIPDCHQEGGCSLQPCNQGMMLKHLQPGLKNTMKQRLNEF